MIASKTKKEMLYKMLEIRCFEEKLAEMRLSGEVDAAIHCCIGQEAISVGVCVALRKEDYIIGNHRSHGHALAKGVDMKRMMAEIFGKAEGTNGGKGGSLHIADATKGYLLSTGIVGSGMPIACGVALASKYKKEDRVTVVIFGDGASNEGTFHESINLATVWQLPLIFMIENNQLAVTTLLENTAKTDKLSVRAAGYGLEGRTIDGQNPEEVYLAIIDAAEKIRKGGGPVLIEAMTCRFQEHAEGKGYLRMQAMDYRDKEKYKKYRREKDPLMLYKQRLLCKNVLTDVDIRSWEEKVHQEIQDTVRFAKMGNDPEKESAVSDIFYERM